MNFSVAENGNFVCNASGKFHSAQIAIVFKTLATFAIKWVVMTVSKERGIR